MAALELPFPESEMREGSCRAVFFTFDSVPINTDGVLNTERGIFTSTQEGKYTFSLAAFSSNEYVIIQIYKNNKFVFHIVDSNNKGNGNNLAYYWMDTLQHGDTIRLNINNGELHSDSVNFVIFNGFLL